MSETRSALVETALRQLAGLRGRELSAAQLPAHAVQLAATLLKLSSLLRSPREVDRLTLLGRMMGDPSGQTFTTLLADRALRTSVAELSVGQARYLLTELGTPSYLTTFERLQLGALQGVGGLVPGLAASGMLRKIREQASAYVISGDASTLDRYIAARAARGIAVNVNQLGEEVISEADAAKRIDRYLELIRQPAVKTLSVKVSSIYSQMSVLAMDQCTQALCERLRPIYRAAVEHGGKLVYLDMEAYRDLAVTFECFTQLMNEPEFSNLQAGIVLQAYLPDSLSFQQELTTFARRRVAAGGSPLRLRIVKGANLAMERLESEQRGWVLPIYASKLETDANYKRMLLTATEPANAHCLHVGIASHNLFDIAYGLVLRATRNIEERVGFELLEGMADALCDALGQLGANVLVYAPFVSDAELPSALAYLVRRLDENTSADNYLSNSFSMRVADPAWEAQKRHFLAACAAIPTVSSTPRRDTTQQRGQGLEFSNEPDSDFTQSRERTALVAALTRARSLRFVVESQIPGTTLTQEDPLPGSDASRPGFVPYVIHLASQPQIERALQNATAAQTRLQDVSSEMRQAWLAGIAQQLRDHRHELTALMVLDAAKRPEEADVEVSEAIDFAEYYARSFASWSSSPRVRLRGRGPTVVTPPWNFPLAIPLGGVLAALVAGNSVILKPALETTLVAQRACELCWAAGVPRDVLQFVVCQDEVGSQLITDPRTHLVVLTGASDTARLFRRLRPDLPLLAETGGKNALYVSPLADREQAILDILQSAFGHAGQKCSALSLLILHRDLYDDEAFLESLREAAASLRCGSAWELDSRVTPLVQAPGALQLRALTQLDPGEQWLLKPVFDAENPNLVSPGLRLGVVPGSFAHQTEFFCPMLSILRAQDLQDALRIANGTGYGLTSGIHTLDEREQALWLRGIEAGNVYVNRKVTGAVVQRQPFGGWKDSSFGPGAKAGGPSYVAQFVTVHALPSQPPLRVDGTSDSLGRRVETLLSSVNARLDTAAQERLRAVAADYVQSYSEYYAAPSLLGSVRGEDNVLRWLGCEGLLIVADTDTSLEMLTRAALAASVCGINTVPLVPAQSELATSARGLGVDTYRNQSEVIDKIRRSDCRRVRYLGTPPPEWHTALSERNCHTASELPSGSGRFELLNYLREQSWSVSTHRYGHLAPEVLRSVCRAAGVALRLTAAPAPGAPPKSHAWSA